MTVKVHKTWNGALLSMNLRDPVVVVQNTCSVLSRFWKFTKATGRFWWWQERCLWAVEGLMFGGLQRGGLAQGGRVELMIEQHGPCVVELRRQLHGRMLGNEKDFPGREFLPSVSKIARKNSYHSTRKRQITHFESRYRICRAIPLKRNVKICSLPLVSKET